MKKKSLTKIRKYVIFVKKNFVLMTIIKQNLGKCKKSEIIVITQENLEELLIVFVIYTTKYFIMDLHMIIIS